MFQKQKSQTAHHNHIFVFAALQKYSNNQTTVENEDHQNNESFEPILRYNGNIIIISCYKIKTKLL